MKKTMFLMLTLLIWGAAGMNAQVTIGADRLPATGAVLDLDKAGGALLLPRFATTGAFPTANAALKGAQAYCNADNLVYTCDGAKWVPGDTKYTAGTGINIAGNVISSTVIDNNTTYTATAPAKVTGTVISINTATASAVGVVKTGTNSKTNPLKIDGNGQISVQTATPDSVGVITASDKILLMNLANSLALRNISANDSGCVATPSIYGYRQVGTKLCWAPIRQINPITTSNFYNWHQANNGITCPYPWHVPSWQEFILFARSESTPVTTTGWTGPEKNLVHWTNQEDPYNALMAWDVSVAQMSDPSNNNAHIASKSTSYGVVRCVREIGVH